MTNEELRNTDAYKLVYETYVYAFQKELDNVDGDATKLSVSTVSQTIAKIITTPQATEILSKLSMNDASAVVMLVCTDLCALPEDSQN